MVESGDILDSMSDDEDDDEEELDVKDVGGEGGDANKIWSKAEVPITGSEAADDAATSLRPLPLKPRKRSTSLLIQVTSV